MLKLFSTELLPILRTTDERYDHKTPASCSVQLEKFLNLFHALLSPIETWVLNISKAWYLQTQSSVQLDPTNNKYTIS
jgi:hypothetical protein